MARYRRLLSESGIYHIILKGVNSQNLFFDEKDYMKATACIRRFGESEDTEIMGYCLMSNHIHLLIKVADDPSVFVKKFASSYVYYFNKKYERTGHLMQERFKSEIVDTDEYALTVFRYILRNPEKAGICRTDSYRWSSWNELYGEDRFCKMDRIIEAAGGKENLIDFILTENADCCMEMSERKYLSDNEALKMIKEISGMDNVLKISQLPSAERNAIVKEIRRAGASVRQISRITGINRGVIFRVGM